ncbi:hypothetical protein AB0G79_22145 [Streptomyces sp. NPDC020807]|uniref:allene oxide cyclase barrel-like domain-containing protein n=1 Tax=Streptomyces sp. NPDC020807 TaxID=3155119 RepID=UPI0033E04885
MTRSFRRSGALGAAAAATVAFGAVAFGAAPPAAADNGDGFEFTIYSKEVPAQGADEGSEESMAAPKAGDAFTFADDLYKTKGGDKIGRDGVTCTVVRVAGTQVDVNCIGTFVLNGGPGGQLTAQALTTFDTGSESVSAYDVALTGGTGDFKDARGYVRVTPDGDYERMEFHVNTR